VAIMLIVMIKGMKKTKTWIITLNLSNNNNKLADMVFFCVKNATRGQVWLFAYDDVLLACDHLFCSYYGLNDTMDN
jgi:hypothetical protein